MNIEIWLAIIAIVATPTTGWLASKLTKGKYNAEIGRLRAEVSEAKANAEKKELENARLGNEIIMENIVRPLETQIKRLNKNVSRLEKAVDKIPACPHSAECPVTAELLANAESDDDKHGDDPADRRAGRTRSRSQDRERRDSDIEGYPSYQPDNFD
jgi:hypothetical protein